MPSDDFDIESLATHLHLSPAQITKMAGRGKLPGRRIGGQWRFSRAEIHHWLEERIGVSNEEGLVEMEGVLNAPNQSREAPVRIHELLPFEAIGVPLQARTQASVITAMTELAATTGMLWDPERMATAVRARESLHPTALDNGVALLHPRRPMTGILEQAFVALGRTHHGIPFGGSGGQLTDIFFLICSTDDGTHLRVLARLSRLIADSSVLTGIRQAGDAQDIYDLILEREAVLE